MSDTDSPVPSKGDARVSSGGNSRSVRRLGRGLSALLGPAAKPVRVDVPRGTGSSDSRIDPPPQPKPGMEPPSGTSESIARTQGTTPAVNPQAPVSQAPVSSVARDSGGRASDSSESVSSEGLVYLRPSEIARNPHQPRERFADQAMKTLIESIRENGLMQPIVVRTTIAGYELVAGERRLRAAAALQLDRIPAVIRRLDDRQSAEWALIENLQREDLNPLERARGVHRLIQEFNLSHQQAAERVGLERASVSNLLRLLDLDPGTASLVARGDLGQGHAKVLLSVADLSLRTSLAQSVIDRQWSVRRLEAEVRRILAPVAPPSESMMPRGKDRSRTQLDDLERRLSEHLGTRVQILVGRQKGQGRLLIEFHGLEHFDGLMERFGFQAD
jgi:ParB family chromosome partitioning protein